MKVLINRITHKISGAEIYNINLLAELKKYKDIEIIFSSNNLELNKRIAQIGIATKYINPEVPEVGTKRQFLKALFLLPIYFACYYRLFKSVGKIDIYIFHSMTEKIFLTPVLFLKMKKIIWVDHGPIFRERWFVLIKLLYKLESFLVTKSIAVSQDTKKDLVQNGIASKKVIVIPAGIDKNYFKPLLRRQKEALKNKLGISGKFTIGYVGSITKEKGIEIFIEVANILSKKQKNVTFLLVGDDPDMDWVNDRLEKYDLQERVTILGFQKNVKNYLGNLDIFFFPTRHNEGTSVALLEAASMELLLIASDMGGNREVITSKTGLLYKNLSVEKLAELLEKTMKHQKKFMKLRHNARKMIEGNYSIDIITKNFYNLLRSL